MIYVHILTAAGCILNMILCYRFYYVNPKPLSYFQVLVMETLLFTLLLFIVGFYVGRERV